MTGELDHRLIRLRDPDKGKAIPPPGFEGIAAAGLFLAAALLFTLTFGYFTVEQGVRLDSVAAVLGTDLYLAFLAFGAFRVRPRDGQGHLYRIFMTMVALQGLFYAAGVLLLAGKVVGRQELSGSALILAGVASLVCALAILGTLTLTVAARRGKALLFAQIAGPLAVGILNGSGLP